MRRAILLLLALAAAAGAQGGPAPERPDGTANWITDDAGVIDRGDRERINEISKALLRDRSIPIVVVTVPDLGGASLERFATSLFDAWGIGSKRHNFGMLMVVAIRDRRARIELGAGWGRSGDADARHVMQTLMIPRFKKGDYSLGILEGVRGLDAMGRGDSIPSPARPRWWWPLWIGLAILVAGSVASIMIQGDEGWGAILVRTLLSMVFLFLLGHGEDGGSGGGYGGGTFGGGFSGGGGASGSW